MTLIQNEEPSKRCKYLISTLRDAFANCHTFRRRLSFSSTPDDNDDEQEVFVSAVLSRYMEAKARSKGSLTWYSCSWAIDPTRGEFSVTPKTIKQMEETNTDDTEDYCSVCSCFSWCSSNATNMEAFISVRSNLSRSSSLNHLEFLDWRHRSANLEFRHCEGWPFGLCRKALLIPPLPKSPSESWLWCKRNSTRMVKQVR